MNQCARFTKWTVSVHKLFTIYKLYIKIYKGFRASVMPVRSRWKPVDMERQFRPQSASETSSQWLWKCCRSASTWQELVPLQNLTTLFFFFLEKLCEAYITKYFAAANYHTSDSETNQVSNLPVASCSPHHWIRQMLERSTARHFLTRTWTPPKSGRCVRKENLRDHLQAGRGSNWSKMTQSFSMFRRFFDIFW